MNVYRAPARVAHVIVDGNIGEDPTVFLMRLPDEPPLRLDGSAAMIWVLAADGEEDVAAAVGELTGLDRAAVADEVLHFLDDLVRRRLLERGPRR